MTGLRRPRQALCWPLLFLFAALPGADAGAAGQAFVLYDRTVRAYGELRSYRDQGRLELRDPASGRVVDEYRFETSASADGRFLFRVESSNDGAHEIAIWVGPDGASQWDRRRGAVRAVPSAAMAVTLALGPAAADALFVPLVLAGGVDLLPGVVAATVESELECGGRSCDLLILTKQDGTTIRLRVDRGTALVRRVETATSSDGDQPAWEITVEHEVEAIDSELAADLLTFEPPAGTPEEVEDYTVSETIDVELRTLAVRAIDNQARPIRGLGAEDFELRVGAQVIPVAGADWITSRGYRLRSLEPPSSRPPGPTLPRDESDGNVIVFFIQADFNSVRVKGHLRILPFVRELLAALEPEDWIAVVSFDSHLKFWQDFSRDRELTATAVERAIRFGAEPLIRPGPSMSLARSFPRAEAKKAASPERALRLTARSLLDIPGEKVILYLGWGLGRYGSTGFQLIPEYRRTLATLKAARASVFVLDITDADYHTLELGIRQVAADTGGTYAKTNRFARREVLRLTETISGYYLLTVDASLLPEDLGKVELRLASGKGEVLLRERQISRDEMR